MAFGDLGDAQFIETGLVLEALLNSYVNFIPHLSDLGLFIAGPITDPGQDQPVIVDATFIILVSAVTNLRQGAHWFLRGRRADQSSLTLFFINPIASRSWRETSVVAIVLRWGSGVLPKSGWI